MWNRRILKYMYSVGMLPYIHCELFHEQVLYTNVHMYVQVPHICTLYMLCIYMCSCMHIYVHVYMNMYMYMYIYCTHSVEFAIHCWVSITEQWLRRRWFAAVVRMVVRIHLIQIHFFPSLHQYVLYIITVEKLCNEDVLYS